MYFRQCYVNDEPIFVVLLGDPAGDGSSKEVTDVERQNEGHDADEEGEGSRQLLSPSPSGQLPPREYFLLFDINGTLLHYTFGKVKHMKFQKSETRLRPGLREFMLFCLRSGFRVIFWSSVKEANLEPRFDAIVSHVPELGTDCRRFGQSWCDECLYRDPADPTRQYWLKRLARLLGHSHGLLEDGATVENTLLIDDTPYKNIKNSPFSAVHPPTCTQYSERSFRNGKQPFLIEVLQPFLQGLKDSNLAVPAYCEQNHKVGQRRCVPGDADFERFKDVVPRCQRGFEIPFTPEEWETCKALYTKRSTL